MTVTQGYGWEVAAPHSAGYLNPVILPVLGPTPQAVLDAGCGNGALAAALAQAGHRVVGVDGDAGGIAHARASHPGLRFEVGQFDQPPLRAEGGEGRFDAVVSTEVVEHLYDPRELARYAFAALRPGGLLAMSTPYHGYAKNLLLSLTGAWDRHLDPHWHGGHIKFWSRATLTRLLRDAGFQITGFRGVGRVPYLWKSMILIARRPA